MLHVTGVMLEYKGVLHIAGVLSWCRGLGKVAWRRWSSLDHNASDRRSQKEGEDGAVRSTSWSDGRKAGEGDRGGLSREASGEEPGEGCQGRQCCKEGAECLTVAEQQSAQTRLSDSR